MWSGVQVFNNEVIGVDKSTDDYFIYKLREYRHGYDKQRYYDSRSYTENPIHLLYRSFDISKFDFKV